MVLEDCFNVLFFLELLVNAYGLWMRPFFQSWWNWFDLLVVSIGVLDSCRVPLPGPMKLIRMLRAFRVFRLFGRIQSLKKILVMIHSAIPGVGAAFMLNTIMLCIYAVLAVDFFKDIHRDCMEPEVPFPGAITTRGKCFGEDYYGTFFRSLYTLFQILTGESWSEAGVRPVLHFYENSWMASGGSAFFFISFILINAVVLLNVVVAVLIEGMNGNDEEKHHSHDDHCDATADELQDDAFGGDSEANGLSSPTGKAAVSSQNHDDSPGTPQRNTSFGAGDKKKLTLTRSKSQQETERSNEVITKNINELYCEVGGLKEELQKVSKQVQESCQTMMVALEEHRIQMARKTEPVRRLATL
mmetsp:Transcript_96101/g.150342  ORF Transcript_96101/g.150342 Transcript_96101/m.150342 type:complete len:357 (+) Transcript_96101:3-1073(+)